MQERVPDTSQLWLVYKQYTHELGLERLSNAPKSRQRQFDLDYIGIDKYWRTRFPSYKRCLQILKGLYEQQEKAREYPQLGSLKGQLQQKIKKEEAEEKDKSKKKVKPGEKSQNVILLESHNKLVDVAISCGKLAESYGLRHLSAEHLYQNLCSRLEKQPNSLSTWYGFKSAKLKRESTLLSNSNGFKLPDNPSLRYYRVRFTIRNSTNIKVFLDQMTISDGPDIVIMPVQPLIPEKQSRFNSKPSQLVSDVLEQWELPSGYMIKDYNYSSVLVLLRCISEPSAIDIFKDAWEFNITHFRFQIEIYKPGALLKKGDYQLMIYMEHKEIRLPSLLTIQGDGPDIENVAFIKEPLHSVELDMYRRELKEAFLKLEKKGDLSKKDNLVKVVKENEYNDYLKCPFKLKARSCGCLVQFTAELQQRCSKEQFAPLIDRYGIYWPYMELSPFFYPNTDKKIVEYFAMLSPKTGI